MATNPETLPAQRRQVPAIRDRQELAARETTALVETAATAVAAHAKAAIEARYSVALHRRRDIDDVRIRLLAECRRPGFAQVAKYRVPRGGKTIEGLSIRFAEAAIRLMGNISIETPTIYDDPTRRIVRVEATDLETNASYAKDLAIEKTVERSSLRKGQLALAERINSSGNKVYLIEATEEDFAVKEAALVSKAIRTLGLRLLPGDLQDEAGQVVEETLRSKVAADPAAERKAIADGFAKVNVAPSHLKQFLGHDLDQCGPAELVELRKLLRALLDGQVTWAEVLAEQNAASDQAGAATNAKAENLRTGTGGNAGTQPEGTGGETPAAETGGAPVDDAETVDGPELNCACPDGLGGKHFRDCAELAKARAKTAAPTGTPSGRGLFGKRGE